MAPETGAQAEFLTVYFCTNGVGTLIRAALVEGLV